ncbi:hypothetical protein V6582_05745 [Agrobacterium vitis]|uniref:hypothetical protein n=1 Tax=Agrobacterium vitis TaxID=373 RepID=UPI0012E7D80B|nr:hypothetical protein [Agrobacterium vitis]MVA24521.1 hypothetical protein [Agrobacterium vitis]
MADLFGFEGKPRQPKRIMMHAVDVGCAPGMMPGWRTPQGAHFKCTHCGHDDGWCFDLSMTEIRRGLPCSICNEKAGA